MLSEAEAVEKLADLIDESRLKHSIAVKETALQLANNYEVEEEKVRWAALLHDSGKGIGRDNLLQKAEEFGIVIDDIERKVPQLLHATVGAEIAKKEFGITDEDILQAIRYHTVGSSEMTVLDKIIFLADYIEPNRDCEKINQLRNMVEEISLDEAVIIACDNTISHNIEQNKIIHPHTIETRNSLL